MFKSLFARRDHIGFARILEFPPVVYMAGSTSDVLIAGWTNGPLGKKHFSTWTSDFQKNPFNSVDWHRQSILMRKSETPFWDTWRVPSCQHIRQRFRDK